MASLNEIVLYLDSYLDNGSIRDDSWNGLQVEGCEQVHKVALAVDAGLETFERALVLGAEMVVVHHGMFWRTGDPSIRDWNKRRVAFLLKNDISLYAAHLPLDKHPEVGNNAQLLRLLGYEKEAEFGRYAGEYISFTGVNEEGRSLEEVESVLSNELGAQCTVLPFGAEVVKRVAVCSGGGTYALFMEAVNSGVDLYITGDSTEMYHMAKDIGMNVIFAGHHATEIVGVRALASKIKEAFSVETVFIDIPTGL